MAPRSGHGQLQLASLAEGGFFSVQFFWMASLKTASVHCWIITQRKGRGQNCSCRGVTRSWGYKDICIRIYILRHMYIPLTSCWRVDDYVFLVNFSQTENRIQFLSFIFGTFFVRFFFLQHLNDKRNKCFAVSLFFFPFIVASFGVFCSLFSSCTAALDHAPCFFVLGPEPLWNMNQWAAQEGLWKVVGGRSSQQAPF